MTWGELKNRAAFWELSDDTNIEVFFGGKQRLATFHSYIDDQLAFARSALPMHTVRSTLAITAHPEIITESEP